MMPVYANYTASITELKKNPSALIKQADDTAVAILNHNRTSAYLVPADVYEHLLERLEDYELGVIVKQRAAEKHRAVEVSLDEL